MRIRVDCQGFGMGSQCSWLTRYCTEAADQMNRDIGPTKACESYNQITLPRQYKELGRLHCRVAVALRLSPLRH